MKTAVTLAFALFLAAAAFSQQAEKLPTADEVLDRYVEATGGKAAWDKLKNRVIEGTFEGPGQRGKASFKEAPEAKNVTVIETKGFGRMEIGTNGSVAWRRSDIAGPQVLGPQEKAMVIDGARFDWPPVWRKSFASARCVGGKRIADKECWLLELKNADGVATEAYFDKKTGLPVCLKCTVDTPQMKGATETYPADYQKVDGILCPHEIRIRALSQDTIARAEKVTHNVDLPPDAFDPPADVKKLLDKKDK